ncbi:hypothetical protein H0H92_004734 [Tricholoma furcatifolium]|nr:hypothetical protein H0H92_004734 [Tricholoma furcatifolium]
MTEALPSPADVVMERAWNNFINLDACGTDQAIFPTPRTGYQVVEGLNYDYSNIISTAGYAADLTFSESPATSPPSSSSSLSSVSSSTSPSPNSSPLVSFTDNLDVDHLLEGDPCTWRDDQPAVDNASVIIPSDFESPFSFSILDPQSTSTSLAGLCDNLDESSVPVLCYPPADPTPHQPSSPPSPPHIPDLPDAEPVRAVKNRVSQRHSSPYEVPPSKKSSGSRRVRHSRPSPRRSQRAHGVLNYRESTPSEPSEEGEEAGDVFDSDVDYDDSTSPRGSSASSQAKTLREIQCDTSLINCPACGNGFSRHADVVRHFQSVHFVQSSTDILNDTSNRRLHCLGCAKILSRKDSRERHEAICPVYCAQRGTAPTHIPKPRHRCAEKAVQ